MKRLTASRVWLTAHCLAFLDDSAQWDETSGPAARTGNAIHKAIHVDGDSGRQADPTAIAVEFALAPYQSKKLALAYSHWVLWARSQDRSGWRHEVGYALDPWAPDARELTMRHERDYSDARPGEVCGTVDVIDTRDGLSIMDWKSGRWVDEPQESEQLLTLAVAAAGAIQHRGPVRAAIVKVNEEGVTPLWAEYDALRLGEHAAELRNRLELAQAGARPVPGEWCKRCPSKTTCPASSVRRMEDAQVSG